MVSGVKTTDRIMSIDALRGFDMLTIIFLDHFFRNLNNGLKTPLTGFFATQFTHPEWYGFHFYDMIFPLFLFIAGISFPFSLAKRTAMNLSLIHI